MSKLTVIAVLVVFLLITAGFITLVNKANKELNIKESFCNKYNLSYREYDCGWNCYKEECYGAIGAFELESKYNVRKQDYHFTLIGIEGIKNE